MRIAIVSTVYPPIVQGGAEKAAALLAEALALGGDHVVVISLHPGRDERIEDRNGVRVYRLPLDNVYWPTASATKPHTAFRLLWHLWDAWNWRAARRVGAILDIERPDVMHTHSIWGFSISVWNEARKRGIRVVHTTHDYYLMCLRSDMFPGGDRCDGRCLKCRVGTAGRRYWANKLDGIISVSKFVLKAHWSRGYFRDVPASLGYNVSLGSNARGRLTVGYPAEPLVFGFIGRLEKQKGIETLLAATRLLSGTNWRLRIAGSGRDVLVMKLRKEYPDPRIEWLGYIEPASFYASIHVTIVASVWDDPLPYVAIESLEHGTALIAARSGGIPEIAALGRVVETFPAGDVKALAARMEAALLRIDRWRTGGFMERSSARMFTPDSVAAKHRERYKDAGVAVNPMVPAPADHSCITR